MRSSGTAADAGAAASGPPRETFKSGGSPSSGDARPRIRMPMTRLPRLAVLALLLVALLTLAGCSTGLKLAYQQLDRLALWTLGDYVSLDAQQKAAFRGEFARLQAWHRSHELPRYSADLRTLARAFEHAPVPREPLEAALAQADAHALRVWEQARPGTVKLIASLRDEQVEAIGKRLRERIRDDEAERRDESLDDRRERWLRQQRKGLERWTGELNPTQKQLLADGWEQAVDGLPTPAERESQRLAEADEFIRVLAGRREPGLGERLNSNSNDRQQTRRERDEARDRSLLIALLQACDAPQRERLQRRLLELAEDFDVLSRASDLPPEA